MNEHVCIAPDVKLGNDVRLSKFINLYGCEVGDGSKIGAFVEIQKNAKVGKNCKISSHSFICEGVLIEDNVFIGHGVTFINDTYPARQPKTERCRPKRTGKWSHGDQEGSIDWIGRDHSLQRDGGRARDRGRGQRGYQECSGSCNRGGKSGRAVENTCRIRDGRQRRTK